MKYKKLINRYLICAFILSTSMMANAGPISKKSVSLSELKTKLPFKVYVPRFIPPGFKLSKAEIISEEGESEKFSPNYALEYCNPKKDCYTFESAGEFGDGAEGSAQKKGNSKIFGAFQIYFFPPNTDGNDSPKNYVLSSWLPDTEESARRYHLFGNGLSIEEAARIIDSIELQ